MSKNLEKEIKILNILLMEQKDQINALIDEEEDWKQVSLLLYKDLTNKEEPKTETLFHLKNMLGLLQ